MAKPKISDDGRTITVRVPISIRKRGGRKLVLAPDGTNVTAAPVTPPHRQRHGQGDRPGVPLARNAGERHARDHRGDRRAEKINESYVGRVLRLTLLAPDIVEAILNWPAAGGASTRRPVEAVSGGVAAPT